jgi:hypothetical protein
VNEENYLVSQTLSHSSMSVGDLFIMKSVKEIVNVTDEVLSPYRGSEATYEMVKDQIRERWGDESADSFDPYHDALPFASWASYGYRVRKGEKALKSITFVETDEEDGPARKIRRTVNLFHKNQVEKAA